MKPFRPVTFAMSMALMLPFGSSVVATATDSTLPTLANSHPPFSITEGRTLNLQETGSQIVIQTIENTLRQGGFALLGEGFQLDSSLNWVFGETIEGEVDVTVPLWNKDGHIVFAQPGAVFWTGLEEEERIDGNLGVVYRTEMAEGVIGGASLFYDHDFQIGHSRLGIGVDAQRKGFYGAFNYYHPLSDTQDGREGYVEDALRGMDARLAVESDVTRFGGNVGYWKFQGDEDVKDDWKLSYGIDAGLRIIPGVFLEGSLQRHDKDVSLGQRANVGLAFKFSLPDFKGKSYGDGGRTSNLYKIVEREKRILYEEREANSPVRLTPQAPDGSPLTSSVAEGNTVTVAGELEALSVPVMLDLVIDDDASSADLGIDFSYGHKVYTLDADTGEQNAPGTATNCSELTCEMMVPAGVTRFDVEIEILADTDEKEIPEEIILQVSVPDEYQRMIRDGETTVIIRAHGNTIAFASDAAATLAEDNVTTGVEVSVNVDLPSPTTIHLNVETSGTAMEEEDYTISPSMLTIPAGEDSATLTMRGINNQVGEGSKSIMLTLSGNLPEGWDFGPVTDPANPPATITHSVSLLDDDLAIGFATPTRVETFNPARIFEESPEDGAQHAVTVRVESTQAAPSGGFDLAWEVTSGADQIDSANRNGGDIDFSDGEEHKEFEIMIENDGMTEDATPVTLQLSTPTNLPEGWNFGLQEYTFTIESSDGSIAFAGSTANMTGNEGETLIFELLSDIATPRTGIPLNVAFAENGADDDLRFENAIVLPAGETGYRLGVEIINDNVAEDAETYTLSVSMGDDFPDGWGSVTAATYTITINASDRTIGFAADEFYAPSTLLEAGNAATITIAVQPPPAMDIIIPIKIEAEDPLSYAPSASSTLSNNVQTGLVLTYRRNMTSETIDISPVSDSDSTNEEITVSIDGVRSNFPDGYSLGEDSTRTITIIDDDGSNPIIRTVSFSKREGNVAEGGSRTIEGVRIAQSDGVQLIIIPELTEDVSIPVIQSPPNEDGLSISAGTLGSTYTNGTVGFDANANSTGVTLLFAAQDDSDSDTEIVTLTIDAANMPANYQADTNNDTWTITVHDDD